MRRYTRFSKYETTRRENASDDPLEVAERGLRRDTPKGMLPYSRTSQAAKQIAKDEATRRQRLTEALKAARLERANRFGKLATRQRRSLPD